MAFVVLMWLVAACGWHAGRTFCRRMNDWTAAVVHRPGPVMVPVVYPDAKEDFVPRKRKPRHPDIRDFAFEVTVKEEDGSESTGEVIVTAASELDARRGIIGMFMGQQRPVRRLVVAGPPQQSDGPDDCGG